MFDINKFHLFKHIFNEPGGIRTPDHMVRSHVL